MPAPGGLCFGDRQDGGGKGIFRFRGVIDEVQLYDRALSLGELRFLGHHPERHPADNAPKKRWSFRDDIAASPTRISEKWNSASLEIALTSAAKKRLHTKWELPKGKLWEAPEWQETALVFDPVTFETAPPSTGIEIRATEKASGKPLAVTHEPNVGWHKIDLDKIEPIPPAGIQNPTNDAIERIQLQLTNSSNEDQPVRLMFEKSARGFRQRIGNAITGMSAVLRDANGNPTGIPVQLSKNWHNHSEGGIYSGAWFHGVSLLHLPKKQKLELELSIVYGQLGRSARSFACPAEPDRLGQQSALGRKCARFLGRKYLLRSQSTQRGLRHHRRTSLSGFFKQ